MARSAPLLILTANSTNHKAWIDGERIGRDLIVRSDMLASAAAFPPH